MPVFPIPVVASLQTLLDRTPSLRNVDDINQLSWSDLRRIGQQGRLRVHGHEFRVAFTLDGGYMVLAQSCLPGDALGRPGDAAAAPRPAAYRIADALNERAGNLCLHVHPRNSRGFDKACRGFAISPDLHAPAFRQFVDACLRPEGGRLREGGVEYRVRVGKPRRPGQAPRIQVTPVTRKARFLCLLNALFHVFELHVDVMSAHRVGERLQGALLTAYHSRARPIPGAQRILDAVQAADRSGLRVDLTGADLAETTLDYVRLDGAILDGASLRGARWSHVSLRGASLAGADLTEARLLNSRFDATSLTHCRGDRAVFRECFFRDASFDGAVLQAPEFDRCELSGMTMQGAQLRKPWFTNIVTDGSWFAFAESIDFAGSGRLTFGPCPYAVTPAYADFLIVSYWEKLLARLQSEHSAPLLATAAPSLIHAMLSDSQSIQAYYPGIALLLLGQALAFLFEHPDYREHGLPDWQKQIDGRLKATLSAAGGSLMSWPRSAHRLASVAEIALERLLDSNAPLQEAAALGPAVMQLVLLGREPDAPPRAATVAQALEAIYRDCLPPDLNRAIDAIEALDDERMFPLVSPDLSFVLLLSPEYFHHRVRLMPAPEGAHRIPWTNLYRLTRVPAANGSDVRYEPGKASVPDDLAFFPLLANAYRKQMEAGLHFDMLELFQLGSRFNAVFLAIASNVPTAKMVSNEHQAALHQIFDPMSTSDAQGLPILVPAHEDALLRLVLPADGSIPAAWLLLCLSVMWTRLSSREFLGETNDSPVAIRRYALALLNTAIEKDPSMLPAQDLQDWQRRLCGTVHGDHTCTQVLSDNMLTLLRATARDQPQLRLAMGRVWPPAWRDQWKT